MRETRNLRDRRALALYFDTRRRDRANESHGGRDAPADHQERERARRAEAYAERVRELLDLVGAARFPYENSQTGSQFEQIVRRASIFDAVS